MQDEDFSLSLMLKCLRLS